ncbi:MAG: hypothetical protein JKY52_05560 [Flavobacteriales bacterium]|nr:hypothetical protein [Flavobacteriales bacterium]
MPLFWNKLNAPVVQLAASELVRIYFEGVIYLFNNPEAVSEGIRLFKLKEIILLLHQTKDAPMVTQIRSSLSSERTFGFKEVVEAYGNSPITIEQLAQLTNNSRSSFKRKFKKIYHTTPGAYLIDKRL